MVKAERFDFPRLESLRLFCRQILQDQVASLQYYSHDVGYQHFKGKNKISISSTATCVLSLVATGSWPLNKTQTKELRHYLLTRKTSAGLPDNNPFTVAWILEALTALQPYAEPLEPADTERVAEMEEVLRSAIKNGGVSIEGYPPSAYLTQLVVRALRNRGKLDDPLATDVRSWAWHELTYQLALIHSKSKMADPFAVAYLVMLFTSVTPRSKTTPEQTRIQRDALKTFFSCQLQDGTWPLSRPLFHYAKVGNAHCYEYEMLTQLLLEPELEELLLEYLTKLSAAAEAVAHSVYRLEDGIRAWTSGHHPQLEGPESWTTASVYHFAHRLDRLLAEAVRLELFRYLEMPFPRPTARGKSKDEFAKDLLDSVVIVRGKPYPLREFVWDSFVKPLSTDAPRIAAGRTFHKATPRSAIFFGPPGTSKTELSKEIAKFLGWPHVAIDPSHVLRNGMEGIQAEANTIFRMLEETERVLVLFDEFDELVRERGSSDAEPFSRLLTTAMLPKLANIHRRATLVFVIATNNIREFDLAIRRPGRFDHVVQIMPPTYDAKIAKRDWGAARNVHLDALLTKLNVERTTEVIQQLNELTFGECEAFVNELESVTSSQGALSLLNNCWKRCTLQASFTQESEFKWAERCKEEAQLSR
jgi:hypothetical protein